MMTVAYEVGQGYASKIMVWVRWSQGLHPGPDWAKTATPDDELPYLVSGVDWATDPNGWSHVVLDEGPDPAVRICIPSPYSSGPCLLEIKQPHHRSWVPINYILEAEDIMCLRNFTAAVAEQLQ